ncbi:DUF397 domain-containing protein [Yinghuangia seranimata]|uniref:DUF397 domain-containing protein n=1 Tax=Yinghuangia seranimata TaxID=408067 RepID=UPI00248C12D9|nr:DUF397 domain-containing protein [Yinghuangia seranimata]MDI2131537.1 DUF397 domain-containing protein [Yinghuangia seranimata]
MTVAFGAHWATGSGSATAIIQGGRVGPADDQRQNGECVEARRSLGAAADLRDSKRPESAYVTFGPEAWGVFLGQLTPGTPARRGGGR